MDICQLQLECLETHCVYKFAFEEAKLPNTPKQHIQKAIHIA
jgi:hypothetical protein